MNDRRILVFGGTIEGRQVSEYLSACGVRHTLCVATEYGEEVLSPLACRTVRQGRMDCREMIRLMREEPFDAVVDATHPYAVEVSRNVRAASEETGIPYLRYLRPFADVPRGASQVFVNSAEEAAAYLEGRSGQIFLTTGSKELHIFVERISDRSRLCVRVLPSAEVLASCRALGLEGKQICAMQGPFSAEINEAMLRQTNAAFLVTKDTGASGGFPEKIRAAQRLGVTVVVIRRPEETGYGWEELCERLQELADVRILKKPAQPPMDASDGCGGRSVCCVGIGAGACASLTQEAVGVIREADILFGAKRVLETVRVLYRECGQGRTVMVEEYSGPGIASYLKEHPGYRRIVILMSGDVGFYSGARGIDAAFPGERVRYCCGISSVAYFASRIPTAWQDAKLLSMHGKKLAVLNYAARYPKILLLVSGSGDVRDICGELAQAGLDRVRVTVGVNLSYPDEMIRSGFPEDFRLWDMSGLHVVMLENPAARHIVTPGLSDETFVRGRVPMTKEEIRILSLAKLRLTEDAVAYDVGAGTGSVAVEIGRLCTAGAVYAIEQNPEGISLIRENCRRQCVANVIPVEGTAPGAMEDLPVPTHAFIGGTAGSMREIVLMLLRKNPRVRIVINTVTLESLAEATALLRELEAGNADIVQISAARSRMLGRYHMMNALNPVCIISFGGDGPAAPEPRTD